MHQDRCLTTQPNQPSMPMTTAEAVPSYRDKLMTPSTTPKKNVGATPANYRDRLTNQRSMPATQSSTPKRKVGATPTNYRDQPSVPVTPSNIPKKNEGATPANYRDRLTNQKSIPVLPSNTPKRKEGANPENYLDRVRRLQEQQQQDQQHITSSPQNEIEPSTPQTESTTTSSQSTGRQTRSQTSHRDGTTYIENKTKDGIIEKTASFLGISHRKKKTTDRKTPNQPQSMTSSYDKWKNFLFPLKTKGPSPPQSNYDTTTIEPIACMSRDLANKLQPAVGGDREESNHFIKRRLFPNEDSRESGIKRHMQQDDMVVKGKGDCGNDESRTQDHVFESSIFRSKKSINTPNTEARSISEIIDLTIDPVDSKEASNQGSPLFQNIHKNSGSPLPFNNVPSPGTQNPALLLPKSSLPLPADNTGKVTSTAQKDKRRHGQTSLVNHLLTPLSKWNLIMFADYINFDDYVHELRLCGQPTGVEDLGLNVLFTDILGMFGADSLKDCMLRENESRVLLDGILMKLCKKYRLCVQMEVPCNLQYLPTGKFDYLITSRDGVPLGCVEAKSPAGMEMKSFCQAVLELNLVQQIALKKGVDVVNTPLFCILSDGYRFIFMQLKGRELLLEHKTPEPSGHMKSLAPTTAKEIKIRKLDDLMLISSMRQLITSSLSSTGETVGKKDDVDALVDGEESISLEMPSN